MLERLERFNQPKLRVRAAAFLGVLGAFFSGDLAHAAPDYTQQVSLDRESHHSVTISNEASVVKSMDQLMAEFQSQIDKTAEENRNLTECVPVSSLVSVMRMKCPISVSEVFTPVNSTIDDVAPVAEEASITSENSIPEIFESLDEPDKINPNAYVQEQPATEVEPQSQTIASPETFTVPQEYLKNEATVQPYVLPEGQAASAEDYKNQQEYLYSILPPVEQYLRETYGGIVYSTLEDMPDELENYRENMVNWNADVFNISPELLNAFHYGEQMGHGFELEGEISTASAAGEGQLTPGYWNGWQGKQDELFVTDPENSQGYGAQVDIDEDGVINPYFLPENIAGTALGLVANGLRYDSLMNMNPAEREMAILNSATRYNANRTYADSYGLPRTQEYAQIILHYVKINHPGLFEPTLQPIEVNYDLSSLHIESESEPTSVSESTMDSTPEWIATSSAAGLIEEYTYYYENAFGVPFTETEARYVESQGDIVSEYLKNGNLEKAISDLYDRQVSAAYAHPDQYPFYVNKEHAIVQQLGLEIVGAQFGTVDEIKHLLDWSANNNFGTINIEEIEKYLESSPQAELFTWLQSMAPKVMGRDLTAADYGEMLYKAYYEAGAKFLDMPDAIEITEGQQQVVFDSIRNQMAQTEEFKIHAPDVLRIRELAPVGSLFKDTLGNIVPSTLRDTSVTYSGQSSPFGLHGNFDFLGNPASGTADWLGEDFVPLEGNVAGAPVLSPISGIVEKVIIGSDGDKGDGEGDSVVIVGEGEHNEMRSRVLHMKNITVSKGDTILKGDQIGEIYSDHAHSGLSIVKDDEIIPVPSLLLSGKDSGLEATYATNKNFREGGVVTSSYYTEKFDMDTILNWIAPWDFAPGVQDHYSDIVKTQYAAIYDALPSLLKK